ASLALSWFLYGFLVAPDLFLKLLSENAQRSILSPHNINLLVFVTNPVVSSSQIFVGSISLPLILGLVGLSYLFLRKEVLLVQLGVAVYLGFAFVLGYIWFYTTIPLYPFFCVGIGYLINDLIFRKTSRDLEKSQTLNL
ncbi:MAG: hypothetical protein OK457_11930, partial [Thaumarchaeota archaeon]|nr:hypothetical protein [Nitrososphaerota archaeon]